MFTKCFLIDYASGFRASYAAIFAQTAKMYDARVLACRNGGAFVNGKNMLELLTLGTLCGDELAVTTDGADAADAISEIEYLFTDEFDQREPTNVQITSFSAPVAPYLYQYSYKAIQTGVWPLLSASINP